MDKIPEVPRYQLKPLSEGATESKPWRQYEVEKVKGMGTIRIPAPWWADIPDELITDTFIAKLTYTFLDGPTGEVRTAEHKFKILPKARLRYERIFFPLTFKRRMEN